MGQKVNPIGLRLGFIKGWESNWFGGKDFSEKLVEDEKIRKYIDARIPKNKAGISKIIIERTLMRITITIHTARPGVVIGKAGAEVDNIKEELKKLTGKDVQINIFEIKRPEIDAKLIGESVAQQIENRVSYRRAMKQAIANAMRVGAQGIKIKVSGRLGGAEMARTETYKEGRIPLHTLRADIDYALSESNTVYGIIGVKVWVFNGEIYGRPDLTPSGGKKAQREGGEGGGNYEGGGDRGNRGGNDRGGKGGNDRGDRKGGNDRGGDRNKGGGPGGNNRKGGGNSGGGNAGGGNRKR